MPESRKYQDKAHSIAKVLSFPGYTLGQIAVRSDGPIVQPMAYRGVTMDQVAVHKEFAARGTTPKEADYPRPLAPVDDLPPITVITHVRLAGGKAYVRGTTSDNGTVTRVFVNQQEAKALRANFAEWEITLPWTGKGELRLSAYAEDAGGNVEMMPHLVVVKR